MYTELDIYIAFRKSQSEKNNRGFRIPKDWDNHFNNKMTEYNRKNLKKITKFFNTKWNQINPELYFNCGFALFKSFSYNKFFDDKVIKLYIERDKIKKRDSIIKKKDLINSYKFVRKYMIKNNIKSIYRYCIKKNGYMKIPIKHYMDNNIDKFFLVWLNRLGFLTFEDDDKIYIPYVMENYRKLYFLLPFFGPFLGFFGPILGVEK